MSYDIGDGYYVDDDGNIQQYATDTTSYQTDGYTDTTDTTSSSGGFNLADIGKLLGGTSSYGMAGQLAGLAGIGSLLNKVLGGGGSGGFAGYRGGIPKYTAARTMKDIPQTVSVPVSKAYPTGIAPRRPGSGGITYFTPMTYTQAAAPAAVTTPVTTPAATDTTATTVTPPATVTREDGSVVVAAGGGMMYGSGGIANLGGYSDGGQLLRGPGDGVSDDIPATIGGRQPARLADGEFVIPARIVSELGNGSTDAGARKLYAMMDRIKATRAKAKNIAANTKADKHLPA